MRLTTRLHNPRMAGMAVSKTFKIRVEPSDQIFEELGNNTYSFVDLLSELIDNSLAARKDGFLIEVQITVGCSGDRKNSYLIITDNASGIPRLRLGEAISPGARRGTGLNEHGLGMKQAIASLGKLDRLLTKTSDDKDAIQVSQFKFGEQNLPTVQVDWSHGTHITVVNLKPIAPMSANHYTRDVVRQLGARYRRYLAQDARKLKLTLHVLDADDANAPLHTHEIEAAKPIYFHPNTRTNKPVIERKKIKGKGWEAELTFGYAPDDKEYAELGLQKPTKFDPYHVSLKKQGLDLVLHDRVIAFHMLSEIGIVDAPHNNYNLVRGEIDLKKGFTTAITKNAIIQDERFKDCVEQVAQLLEEGEYLQRRTYPDDIPENILRDRLAKWLSTNKMSPKKDVKMEYAVQGLAGSIDILADGEAWELKRDEANGLDVYQLFAYLDMGGIRKGYLVAKSFSTGGPAGSAFSSVSSPTPFIIRAIGTASTASTAAAAKSAMVVPIMSFGV